MPTKLLVSLYVVMTTFLFIPLSQAQESTTDPSPRPSPWAHSVNTGYNLYQMTPMLYRSKQPDIAAMPLIQGLHIVTVVNLIKEPDDWLSDPAISKVQIPIKTKFISDAEVLQALRAIQVAERKGPVLIHCKHGLDRTGLISAMYRVVIQGWSKQAALDEMSQGGFGDEDRLDNGISYMNDVDVGAMQTALASGACSTSPLAMCSLKQWFARANLIEL